MAYKNNRLLQRYVFVLIIFDKSHLYWSTAAGRPLKNNNSLDIAR